MKIFSGTENIYDAVNEVVKYGILVLGDSTTPATNYAHKVIEHLKAYPDIAPEIGFKMCDNDYFYYIVDLQRYSYVTAPEVYDIIDKIAEESSIKLAKMKGKKYYFVRTESMRKRADTKVNKNKLNINVILLADNKFQ